MTRVMATRGPGFPLKCPRCRYISYTAPMGPARTFQCGVCRGHVFDVPADVATAGRWTRGMPREAPRSVLGYRSLARWTFAPYGIFLLVFFGMAVIAAGAVWPLHVWPGGAGVAVEAVWCVAICAVLIGGIYWVVARNCDAADPTDPWQAEYEARKRSGRHRAVRDATVPLPRVGGWWREFCARQGWTLD